MAKIYRLYKGEKSRKRKERFKMRMRSFFFKLSMLTNLTGITYLLYQHGYLTNIIDIYNTKVAPILESLINQLPL